MEYNVEFYIIIFLHERVGYSNYYSKVTKYQCALYVVFKEKMFFYFQKNWTYLILQHLSITWSVRLVKNTQIFIAITVISECVANVEKTI